MCVVLGRSACAAQITIPGLLIGGCRQMSRSGGRSPDVRAPDSHHRGRWVLPALRPSSAGCPTPYEGSLRTQSLAFACPSVCAPGREVIRHSPMSDWDEGFVRLECRVCAVRD